MTERRRPPLGSLRVFVAAAQAGSVTGAAAELHLTHGAVSHQLRQLQDYLGIALFEHAGRGVKLTEAGTAYAADVARGLAQIDKATDKLLAAREHRRLRVSCMPSFAARWLLPRLGNFISAHREIDVEVQSSLRLADIKGGEADVALRYGRGLYPGLSSQLLMNDWHYPVCSPQFAARNAMTRPEQLLGLPLLHSDNEPWWPWLRAAGVDVDEPQHGTVFDDSSLMLMAAVAGQGVALTRHTLAIDDLAAGRLIRPFPIAVATPYTYYFVCRPGDEEFGAVAAFRQWLFDEAATYQPPDGQLFAAEEASAPPPTVVRR